VTFAFVYPAAIDWSGLTTPDRSGTNTSPACLLATAGGFVYFDRQRRLCAFSGACSLVDQQVGPAKLNLLQFEAPIRLPPSALKKLQGRMQHVTLASLLAKGATHFAWITPAEELPDLPTPPLAGAFAYKIGDEAIYFPVVDNWQH